MTNFRRSARIVLVNILVFFALLGFLAYGIPSILWAINSLRSDPLDDHASSPAFASLELAQLHFRELRKLESQYYDFIGWRRKPFSGETVTVDSNGVRTTVLQDSLSDPVEWSVGFFGGSTMWGTGVDNQNTIPSLYSVATGRQATNYGESGWVSQQSTNQMIQLAVDDALPDVVVFYDGVNDVLHKCESTNTPYSGPLEAEFRAKITWPYISSVRYAIAPVMRWIDDIKVGAILKSNNQKLKYNCDVNLEKGRLVARNLVENWLVAQDIADRHGSTFIPILQPVSFIGEPTVSHLTDEDRNADLGRQYETVYALVQQYAVEAGIDFVDLTSVLDVDGIHYFDFCHVNARGNARIADAFVDTIHRSQ